MVCTEITDWFSNAVTRGGQLKQYCCLHNESRKLPKCSFCLTILRKLDLLQLVGIVFPFFRRGQLQTPISRQWAELTIAHERWQKGKLHENLL